MDSHAKAGLVSLLERTAEEIKDKKCFRRNFRAVKNKAIEIDKIFKIDDEAELERISINHNDSPLHLLHEKKMTVIGRLRSFINDMKYLNGYSPYLENKHYETLLTELSLFFEREYKVNGVKHDQVYEY